VSGPPDADPLESSRRYLAGVVRRLEELQEDIAGFRASRTEAATALRAHFHYLAVTDGAEAFPELRTIAREMEAWISSRPAPGEAPRLEEALGRIAALIRRAQASIVVAGGARRRAIIVLPESAERTRLADLLTAEGYDVRATHRSEDPASVAPDGRPDLLIIGTAAGEGDPSAVASSWTGRSPRPRAVVLVETLRGVDRLRAIASGVDAVVEGDTMLVALPRYARTLAQAGPPPSTVLLVEAVAERAARVAEVLEAAGIRVVRCAVAHAVQELLEREVPGLMLLATSLPDGDGAAVAGWVRADPRFRLLPIVFSGPDDVADRLRALRADAEDYLPHAADPALLLHTVVARAERGRRLRELLHRDALTGLLNQATLLAELEHAVDYGRRHGDTLALVVFDLDRFHEVNERFGHTVGDQVLRHVANIFRANVRASDVIGRFGGEEFGMLLRGVGAAGAAVLTAKLRRVLGDQSATTAEGVIIPLHVSVGAACFPADGASAGDLVHVAVRAMQREKAEKG
jgi:diguanylate cyclase (GGDEF)-like protein